MDVAEESFGYILLCAATSFVGYYSQRDTFHYVAFMRCRLLVELFVLCKKRELIEHVKRVLFVLKVLNATPFVLVDWVAFVGFLLLRLINLPIRSILFKILLCCEIFEYFLLQS
jgi:hypothetical protein